MKSCILLRGGLGNQLFQIAYLHAFQRIKSVDEFHILTLPKVDHNRLPQIATLMNECRHGYSVKKSHKFLRSSPRKFQNLISTLVHSTTSKKWLRLIRFDFEDLEFSPVFQFKFPLKRKIVVGNFQHWKYVEAAGEDFLDELRRYLNSDHQIYEIEIKVPYAAIHLRKGDYQNTGLGVLDLHYYLEIVKKYPNLNFAIFTDDIHRGRSLAKLLPNSVVFGPDICAPWEVIYHFSRAQVCIPANSTLSWWGSYLALKSGSKVYIPDPWFQSHSQTFGAFRFPGTELSTSKWEGSK